VTDVDGAVEPVQGPDRVAVQFPARRVEGMQRPFFLGGDRRRPVYTWRWASAPDQLQVGTATGPHAFTPGDASDVTHGAAFADGQWQLQLTRGLDASDSASAPSFAQGEAIPIAFQAADGSSGENAVRGSVSAWYAIYLDVPTPAGVFITPLVAALFTAGLGVLVVTRAQRRNRGGSTEA
jgi:DMSO reductase family type II enzyme heme b subunit